MPGEASIQQTEEQPSAIVRPIPSASRESIASFDFVSSHVRRMWLQEVDTIRIADVLGRLRKAQEQETRDVLGRVFKEWVLLQIKNGQVCSRRQFNEDGGQDTLKKWNLPQNLCFTEFFGNDCTGVRKQEVPAGGVPVAA
eukprot:504388-Amphidinium_carterae.1